MEWIIYLVIIYLLMILFTIICYCFRNKNKSIKGYIDWMKKKN